MTTRDSSLNPVPADSEPKPSADELDQSLSALLASSQESERHQASPSAEGVVKPGGLDYSAPAEAAASERVSLLRLLPRFAMEYVAAWREWRVAKQAGQAALDFYQTLRAKRPDLAGKALYEALVCERNRIEASAARTILRHAEESFAAWPNERDLVFRDVVQYLVISEYLVSHPKRVGTTINMSRVISRLIPMDL
jgi:hypothetical protein